MGLHLGQLCNSGQSVRHLVVLRECVQDQTLPALLLLASGWRALPTTKGMCARQSLETPCTSLHRDASGGGGTGGQHPELVSRPPLTTVDTRTVKKETFAIYCRPVKI